MISAAKTSKKYVTAELATDGMERSQEIRENLAILYTYIAARVSFSGFSKISLLRSLLFPILVRCVYVQFAKVDTLRLTP